MAIPFRSLSETPKPFAPGANATQTVNAGYDTESYSQASRSALRALADEGHWDTGSSDLRVIGRAQR